MRALGALGIAEMNKALREDPGSAIVTIDGPMRDGPGWLWRGDLPHGVTPELASDPRLGLHPIAAAIDECQIAFEYPVYGKEVEEIATDLTKRGPALGMLLILATQRPDARSIPTGISANACSACA